MTVSHETSWTLIRAAAGGGVDERAEFVRRYQPVVRAYLRSRWGSRLPPEDVEDAAQEVFVECFRTDGALDRSLEGLRGEFRSFLLGVVRNVALRAEKTNADRRDRPAWSQIQREEADETRLSQVFDRAWARALVRQAFELQAAQARQKGGDALRRVELLRLRIAEDQPIRAIAKLWGVDVAQLHHQYAAARKDFERALREVVGTHYPDSPERMRRECEALLDLLQ
jgi:RNA polymerase sigma factor (sigma-70 family)